jgi:hypothetical protein
MTSLCKQFLAVYLGQCVVVDKNNNSEKLTDEIRIGGINYSQLQERSPIFSMQSTTRSAFQKSFYPDFWDPVKIE